MNAAERPLPQKVFMKIAVIGGGAAGLVCAYFAALGGGDVTVYEKNEKCGKKIYITGKGRCNITNDIAPEEFLQNVVNNAKFLTSAVYSFSPSDTINFFESGGLSVKRERGSRIFPVSDKASDVTKCLENYCKSVGVKFKFGTEVQKIEVLQGTMRGIICDSRLISYDKVVICTGGKSYPSTGSCGDGYKFASECGHSIVKPVPALCGINLEGDYFFKMQGLSLKNVSLTIKKDGKQIKSLFGEMLFTHFGISGPIVLSSSSLINRMNLNEVKLYLDFKPALSREQLDKRILSDFSKFPNKSIYNCLRELLPVAAISPVLNFSGISEDKKVNAITREEREILLKTLKEFEMQPTSLRGFDEAIVTSGGVNVKEINPKTMESKIVKGLYFCGEVLDCDAFTGGFNLQIAFSTGYAAGNAVNG